MPPGNSDFVLATWDDRAGRLRLCVGGDFVSPLIAFDVAASTLGPETRLRALRAVEGVSIGATRFGTGV